MHGLAVPADACRFLENGNVLGIVIDDDGWGVGRIGLSGSRGRVEIWLGSEMVCPLCGMVSRRAIRGGIGADGSWI